MRTSIFPTQSTRRRRYSLLAAAAGGLALAGIAQADLFYEDFSTNSDTRWIGNGNRSAPGVNDYGWSNTDVTGTSVNAPGHAASGAGEFGGAINRGNFSDYGYNIGSLTPTDTLHADGVYQWVGGAGNWFWGFYNQANHITVGSDPVNFIGFQLDDSFKVYLHEARSDNDQRTHSGPQQLPQGQTVQWSMDYDGAGKATWTINGVTVEQNLGPNYFTGGSGPATVFNRFGFFPGSTSSSVANIVMDDITFTIGVIVTTPPVWNVDSSGDWNSSTNWDTGQAPDGIDKAARFLGAISSARTVYSNTAITVGSLEFNNANTYVLTGAGSLSMDVSTGSAQIGVVQGSHNINLPLFIKDNTVANVAAGATLTIGDPLTLVGGSTLTKTGSGAMNIISTVTTAAPAVLATSGGVLNAKLDLGGYVTINAFGGVTNLESSQHVAAVNISNGASVKLSAGGNKVLKTMSLAISGSGNLDLSDNDAIIDYTGSVGSQVSELRLHLLAGRLSSSSAVATHRLGYGDNAVLGKATFAGEAVDASSLLIKYTFSGDANLDGQVDITDLAALASAWQTNAPWTSGDFDYSGFVDITDLAALATNWQAGAGAPLAMSFEQALASVGLGGVPVVPEPSMLGGLAALALVGVRRRRA